MTTQTPPREKSQDATSPAAAIREPVLKINPYDRLSAGMIAMVLGLIVSVLAVFVFWMTTRPPRQDFLVPLEMIEVSGGVEDGAPDETLKIESPEDPTENPSQNDEVLEEQEISEVMESVVELADRATQQAQQVMAQNSSESGTPGSADGTGRRGLGEGPGDGGVPNEQRWLIRYSDDVSLSEYAKQLDFFGIELGALASNGEMTYVSKLSSGSPIKRVSRSGKGENRLYMTWQAGQRKDADVQLFEKAGVNAKGAIIFHFYPKPTEQMLLTKEYEYANRSAKEIRRTYFSVVKQGNGYSFVVTRQSYLR